MTKARISIIAAALAVCAFAATTVHAADYYKGKRLTIIINYSAGGPTDVEGRMFARYYGKYIPGHPEIIVKNIAGAGGNIGVNYLGERAKPDGLTMGFFTGLGSTVMMMPIRNKGLEVNPEKFPVIATETGLSIGYMRSDVPPGIHKPEDIVKASGFKVGGLNIYSSLDIRERMALDMLGVKYKYVTGYRGASDVRAAIQKNEVQYTTVSQPSFQSAVMPTMVKTGMVTPIMYYDYDTGDSYGPAGALAKNIPAPTFSELYRKIKGKEPSGPMFEAFRAVNRSGGNVQRLLVVPAGTPVAAVEALRTGVAGVEKDPGYRGEALKMLKFVPNYVIGDAAEKLVKKSIKTTPAVIAFLRNYIAKVQPKN